MKTVVVFKTIKEEYIKSSVSNMKTFVPQGTLVAFDENDSILYYSDDRLEFSTEKFIDIAMIVDTEEMEYSEYMKKYKDYLMKFHGNAPVIKLHESSEFSPHNPFQRLVDLGVSFKLFWTKITHMI